ncbi:MAG: hypothetical protein LBL73_09740 [Synergistaceae bacterium]|jgi:hypothetical protein|nr:hypothetical protein [Synergistaceae bacterium]
MTPRLIHPRSVTLHRRKATAIDAELGPTGEAEWHEPLTLQGQVRYEKYDRLIPTGGGNDPASDGHVAFTEKEWAESGGKAGDEMELSPSESRLVVTEVRPAAHYRGRAWHVHVLFVRRRAGAK